MFVIETTRSRRRAEHLRDEYVHAQIVVDSVWRRITGEEPVPPAQETYHVVREGRGWAVVCVDPSS